MPAIAWRRGASYCPLGTLDNRLGKPAKSSRVIPNKSALRSLAAKNFQEGKIIKNLILPGIARNKTPFQSHLLYGTSAHEM